MIRLKTGFFEESPFALGHVADFHDFCNFIDPISLYLWNVMGFHFTNRREH